MNDAAQQAKVLPQGMTDAELKKLIAKHGPIHSYIVELDGRTHVLLARKPKLAELTLATGDGSDPMGGASKLFNTCAVAKDEAFDTDDEVRVAGIKFVAGLFRTVEGRLGEVYA